MARKLVIADTSVWISYQRDPGSPAGQELDALLATREVVMVGPVLAEILQGSRSDEEFDFLAENLYALEFVDADKDTWVRVGKMGTALRRAGKQRTELNHRLQEANSLLSDGCALTPLPPVGRGEERIE